MTDDETFVRANWKRVSFSRTPLCGWIVCMVADIPIRRATVLSGMANCDTAAAAWSAAAEFTRERLEQIRQLREEIAQVEDWAHYKRQEVINEVDDERVDSSWTFEPIFERTLDRLQQALTELTKDMTASGGA